MALPTTSINLPTDQIADFCRRWKMTELALFGSALRDDFGPESDIDLLATFEPDAGWSLFDLVAMQDEITAILGRDVDLIERGAVERGHNSIRRQDILTTARTIYNRSDPDLTGAQPCIQPRADADHPGANATTSRSELRDDANLLDIAHAVREILTFTEGHTLDSFRDNAITRSAVEYAISALGRAVGRLSADFRARHPDQPWDRFVRMGEHVIRSYYAVDLNQIWTMATEDVPPLLVAVEALSTPPS